MSAKTTIEVLGLTEGAPHNRLEEMRLALERAKGAQQAIEDGRPEREFQPARTGPEGAGG